MSLKPFVDALRILDRHPPAFAPSAARRDALLRIGAFLERSTRPAQAYDLKAAPPGAVHPVWREIEARLARAIAGADAADLGRGQVSAWQMYNDGVVLRTGSVVIGLDVVPMPRCFGWPETPGLTEGLAGFLDLLLITHEHGDHYDRALVGACLRLGKPVLLPRHLARDWGTDPNLFPVGEGFELEIDDLHIRARRACHVWREDSDEMPLAVYEVACQEGFTFLFTGDADYTKDLAKSPGRKLDLLFVPWRAPNERYEDGRPEQVGSIFDALSAALRRLEPRALLYEHCAELDHVYGGFAASFDIALDLQRRISVPSELMFWGETIRLA